MDRFNDYFAAERLRDYFAMGGHAQFIWPALGITAVVLIGIMVSSLWAARTQTRALANLEAVVGDASQRRARRRAASDAATPRGAHEA